MAAKLNLSESALTIEAFSVMEELPAYSPQAISDILPIYRPHESESHLRTYNLRQISPNTQNLHVQGRSSDLVYNIKSNKTGGFMNRKPHVIISGQDVAQPIAEGRFDIHGTGTTISYSDTDAQRIELEDSLTQTLRTSIQNSNLWWQPHPGNKEVVELSNETDEIIARFVYASDACRRTGRAGSITAIKRDQKGYDVGELQVIGSPEYDESVYERILCSAIVVIERARRRAAHMANTKQGPPCGGMSISGGIL
ncbi:hypothetical protein ACLMJK_006366 [Lecanora helva]